MLVLAGAAMFFVSLDSSVLILGLPAIADEFHASLPALANLGSVLALGAILGLPPAMLADRLGRRRVLVVSVAAFSLANLASALAPSLAALAGLRLLAVCFETAAASVAVALVVEEVERHRRGQAVAVITVFAGAGAGLTTILYPLVAPHWRLLYLVGAAGLAAALALHLKLPESRAWQAAPRAANPAGVLLERRWRGRLLLVALVGALGALLYEPAGLLLALFGSRDLGLGPVAISAVVVVSGVVSAPAFLFGGRLSDHFGRRRLGAALVGVTAAFCVSTFSGGRPAYLAGSVLWSFFASAGVPVLGAWYGELFPTRARVTSEAVGAVAMALGGIAGLQLVALAQARLALGGGLELAGAGALLGAGLLLLLPETRGVPLPE